MDEDLSDDQGAMNTNDDDLDCGENGGDDERSADDDFPPRDDESEDGSDEESWADDDYPAGMHRSLDVLHVRALNKKKNMQVTLWSGKDLSWYALFGTLVRIIKWRYIGDDEERGSTRRYQSFHSAAVALVAFFVAFGVTQVTGDIPLTSDEEKMVKQNIDVIVPKLKEKYSKFIKHANADKLTEAAKAHVPSLWSKLEDVKRGGMNIWTDSNRDARKKNKNMHQDQKDLYMNLGISFNNASQKT